jgi:hypothetical protein
MRIHGDTGAITMNYGLTAASFSGNLTGNVTGNADTATSASKWTTARTITLGGDLTGNVSIDGSSNVTLTAAVVNDSHTHDGRYYTETEVNRSLAELAGWVPAYSNGNTTTVNWDKTNEAVALSNVSGGDQELGMSYKAIRMKAGDKVRIGLMTKGSVADTDGFYIRIYFYNGDLPDGKTHVSNSASYTYVQEDSSGDTGWWENNAVTTTWKNFYRTYTAPADGYMSIVILNWAGYAGTLYVKQPDIQFEKVNQATSADNAGTLDSLDSSQFLRSDTSDTMSGVLTVNSGSGNNPAIFQSTDSVSYVTIKDNTAETRLVNAGSDFQIEVNNGNAVAKFFSDGDMTIYGDDAPKLTLHNEYVTGDWTGKTDLGSIEWYTPDTSGNAPYTTGFIRNENETGGTLPSGALVFGTTAYNNLGGAVERMRITSTGDVGIGTSSPNQKLEIRDTAPFLRITTTINDDLHEAGREYGGIEWYTEETYGSAPVTTAYVKAIHTRAGTGHQNADAGLVFATSTASSDATATERMRIESATGFVGIGTASPTFKLHIEGEAFINPSSASAALLVGRYTGTPSIKANGDDGGYLLMDSSGGMCGLNWYSGDHVILALGGGSVGVGTTVPSYKLDVAGSINTNTDYRIDGVQVFDTSRNLVAVGGTFSSNVDLNGNLDVQGRVGIGTDNSSAHALNIQYDQTNPNADYYFAQRIDANFSGADNTTSDREQGGIFIDIDSSADGDASNEHRLYGVFSDVRFTGFTDEGASVYGYWENNNGTEVTGYGRGVIGTFVNDCGASGGTTYARGVEGFVSIEDNGVASESIGVFGKTAISGNRASNVGSTYGGLFEVEINATTAIGYGDMYGVRSQIDNNEGTVPSTTNSFLFYGNYQGTRHATNSYGLYIEGDKHYLEGSVGIGITSPSYKLHIAGTAYSTQYNTDGSYKRTAAGYGYLDGGYSSVEYIDTTHPIYCISSSYAPNATTLNNMYGIGYALASSASFISMTGATGWGQYVAADGDARIWLSGSDGHICGTGNLYVSDGYFTGNLAINTGATIEKVTIGTAALASAPEYIVFSDASSGSTWAPNQKFGGIKWRTADGSGIGAHDIAEIRVDNMYTGAIPTGDIIFSTSSYNANPTEKVRITSGGNVGIGTDSPTSPLHIDGGGTNEVLKIEANADPYIRWVENGVNVGFLQFKGDEAYLSNQSNGTFYFRTNNTNKMVISGGGDVGIGTTSPSQKLDVVGTVKATAFSGDGSALTGISTGAISSLSIDKIYSLASMGASGYMKLVDGLLIQWGSFYSNTDGTQTVSFPTTFTTVYTVYTSLAASTITRTTSSFTVDRLNDLGNSTHYFVAIGYTSIVTV